VSAKAVDAKVHGSVSDAATVQTILTSHDAQEEIKSAFLTIHLQSQWEDLVLHT